MTSDELEQIKARAVEAAPDGIVDMGAQATRDLVAGDVPRLIAEIERLRERIIFMGNRVSKEARALRKAIRITRGALADIALMTPGEIAAGVAQKKAQRIYNETKGADE